MEEGKEQREQVFAHRAWWNTQPVKLVDGIKQAWTFGSKGASKMMEFIRNYKVNNALVDSYMSLRPERYEEEEITDYKIRRAFQKALLKYRELFYKHPPKTIKQIKNESKQREHNSQ